MNLNLLQKQQQEIDIYTWYRLEIALKSYLKQKVQELPTWAKKKGYKSLEELHDEYRNRLVYEFTVVKKMGFCGYFLIVSDIIAYCRENDIPTGPGRGSAAGCILSFLLKITKIDPVRFSLLFERFMNPDRISMPDIDLDISQALRGQVKEYLGEKYGLRNVANIGTFSRMKVRAAVKDIVRSLNLAGDTGESFRLADRISKTLDEEDPNITHEEALRVCEPFRNYMQQYPVLDNHIKHCENILRQMSMHAAGVLISANPLDEELPLMVDKNGMVVTAYDGKTVENLGYLKLDTLGLKNLDTIASCRAHIKKFRSSIPKMELEPLIRLPNESLREYDHRADQDDNEERRLASKAFKYLREKSTLGIFQCEMPVTQQLLRKGEVNSIEGIADVLALIRPGPRNAGSTDVYIRRIRGEEPISYLYDQTHAYNPLTTNYDGKELDEPLVHDLSFMSEICDATQGLPLFQEQLMQIATRCANFTKGESDKLRKGVGKKDAIIIREIGEKFMKGMQKGGELNPSGCSLEAAEFLWFKFILPYGSYGFNLSHSIAYSFIAYETVWLKANFPGEFYAALLSHESDQDKANTTITEAKSAGIRFLPPDINKSTSTFTITDPTTIVYSLTCMKGVGDSAVEKIVRSRQYKNMVDFLGRSDVNASVIKALIMGGAFDNAFTEEHVTRKNYYDFFEDARGKLNRQTDRFLRQALLRKFNFQELKGEEKKKATLEGTYESPANFHKRMLETNEEYQAEYKRRELEEIAKFTYDWNEPITENSKGLVTAVERATKDDRNKWNMSEQFDFEEEIYGTTLSGHRLDPYYVSEKDFIQGTKNSGWDILNLAEDLNLYEKGQEVYIFCLGIKEATKFPYRNNPKAFVRSFEIEDRNGKGRITVFDQTFINLLKSNNLCLSILSKKLPHRPVMILKCKIDENKSMRQLVLDSVVQWVNEIEIKEEIKSIKMKELKIEEEVSRLAE